MAYRSRVVFSERSRPEIFCWVFAGRRSRSAWLGVGGMAVPVRNRSTSASRVFEAFQQVPGGRLLGLCAWDAADGGQAGVDAVPEQAQVPRDRLIRDDGQSLAACEVGGVDEGAQLAGDLPGPDRLRVGLGGVL